LEGRGTLRPYVLGFNATRRLDCAAEDPSSGSSVVGAVVKPVRREIGHRAGQIETGRGLGYRWWRGLSDLDGNPPPILIGFSCN
jgi:hypothetical protein